MTLATMLKNRPKPKPKPGPLWTGPGGEGPNGGVTQSMIGRFLNCRERFRIRYVEGLESAERWSHRLGYGEMWHKCEETFAGTIPGGVAPNRHEWEIPLKQHCIDLCRQHPLQQDEINHWYQVCKVQFPLYVQWWAKHPDQVAKTSLLQEQVFDVPYKLPSGRTVRLRGKWDGVSLIGKGKSAGVYLDEHKTKGDIDPVRMQRQLGFDLQTMTYLVALEVYRRQTTDLGGWAQNGISGVHYNVVRRPLSGGKGSIVRHKPSKSNPQGESAEEYYARLGGIIETATGLTVPEWGMGPGDHFYFMRWRCEVSAGDITRFRREFLDPILEQMCDWWRHVDKTAPFEIGCDGDLSYPVSALHWRHPFGVYNSLDEGGATEYDAYIESGSTAGLRRAEALFGELK